uniref:Uncharacterized protein n=1 Tax=Trieres chinensis TaxID=1514140 RepID=A0A7S2A1U6_TRICV|mmetsp:Transcript_37906/g.77350  ORF Transcript_37906/g.77350 Transcript_37906/m.77350 type:complete len:235 (+) Transcript_37906:194-898(+)|eukprot:CAMPEP_0183307558 /NCGR_PEP_ID=MMETSP0160_2-20130417/18005_1 /TAXON_ID=2839 ORGANISM="Odontella Sinensis, Strain Grunow 1884" /NCGR_SAMPLE_ID=MMETSP0160_2 /ASSEMBLY_ACC=CAM_ASM_000250 /LENGTH=234 /DNA_ID=CAMNT_0025471167 /DNA_START=194 /DNA_END=898 /DNA_ORIENTATION=+
MNLTKALLAIVALAAAPSHARIGDSFERDVQGKRSLVGHDYQLIMNCVPKEKKNENFDSSGNGRSMFIPCEGKTKIYLYNSDDSSTSCTRDYEILDRDGLDGSAEFCLPDPFPGDATEAVYQIKARVLGKSGKQLTIGLCATIDELDDGKSTFCTLPATLKVPGGSRGKSWDDVSQELLTICAEVDGVQSKYGLFDDDLEDEFWELTNDGVKTAQFRFYAIESGGVTRDGAVCK